MRIVKCPKCCAFYEAIPAAAAQQAIATENAESLERGVTPNASMQPYLECFHCATSSSSFLEVSPEDIPPGCTLAQVALEAPMPHRSTNDIEALPSDTGAADSPVPQDSNVPETHYLEVPKEMWGFAEQHGAKFDASRSKFFVSGDVPWELFNFLPKAAPKARPHIVAPQCPICKYHTVLIKNTKSGSWFYGCSQYSVRNCPGKVDYDKHLASIGKTADISAFAVFQKSQVDKGGTSKASPPSKAQLDEAIQNAIEEIAHLGVEILGSAQSFKKWLEAPKLALKQKRPIEEMQTLEGCRKIKALLRTME